MKKNYVCYPVVLSEKNGLYKITIPINNLKIEVESKGIEEVVKSAKEALGIYLHELDELPKVEDEIKVNEDEMIIYIDVDLKLFDERQKYKSINRMVTLPYYLNEKAKESGINVSAVLQEALINKLTEED